MERYLEGEEISHEEIVTALKEGTNHGGIFPVTCGVATAQPRHEPPARRDRGGPALAGQARRRSSCPRSRSSPTREAPLVRLRLQDEGRPVRRPDQLLPRLPGHDAPRQPRPQHARPRQGAHRPAAASSRARRAPTPTSSARATSARSPSSRRRAPATGSPSADEPIQMPAVELPAAGDGVRDGAEDRRATRTRSSRALRRLQEEDPTIDLHRDAADRRADRRRPLAGARRGDRRPAEARASAPR